MRRPTDPRLWASLASTNISLNRIQDAIISLHRAIRLTRSKAEDEHDQELSDSLITLGDLYADLNRYQEAVVYWKLALRGPMEGNFVTEEDIKESACPIDGKVVIGSRILSAAVKLARYLGAVGKVDEVEFYEKLLERSDVRISLKYLNLCHLP